MARSRNIKPAFFANDDLAELPALTRLYFIGLWTIADFKGCIEYRPKRLKAQILPYDDCDIAEMSKELMRSDFIRGYSVAGTSYIKVVNFSSHQNPHKQEVLKGSDLPDISEAPESKGVQGRGAITGLNPNEIGCHPPDSFNLIPDSLNPITDSVKPDKIGNDQSAIDPVDLDYCFDQFWKSGIKKTGKKKAKPLFARTLKNNSKPDGPTIFDFTTSLIADIQKRLASDQLGFAEMHPTTYLNGERWTDEITNRENHNGQNRSSSRRESLAERSSRQTAEALARIEAEEANTSPVGANDNAVRTQVGQQGRPAHDGERSLLDGLSVVVPENGALGR